MIDRRDDQRIAIDRGELRDKVDAADPAAAPLETDSEAAGMPHPAASGDADARQKSLAASRVPVPDVDRVAAVSRERRARDQRARRWRLAAFPLVILALVTALLVLLTV